MLTIHLWLLWSVALEDPPLKRNLWLMAGTSQNDILFTGQRKKYFNDINSHLELVIFLFWNLTNKTKKLILDGLHQYTKISFFFFFFFFFWGGGGVEKSAAQKKYSCIESYFKKNSWNKKEGKVCITLFHLDYPPPGQIGREGG